MARNRQRAKQRRARREAVGRPAQANSKSAAAAAAAASGTVGAPPQDEGTVNAAAIDVKDELKQERKAAKAKPAAAPAKPSKAGAKAAAAPKERGRLMSFFRSSWAELRRVQWPTRNQVTTLTTIVIGFVIIAGAYLGVIDWVANQLVNLIIF